MFQAMGSKIPGTMTKACQVIMRKTARPHDFSPCIIIIRVIPQDEALSHNGPQQAFCEGISKFHTGALDKIAFQRMHDDITAAAGRLVSRQGHGKFRVHDSKNRAGQIAVIAPFSWSCRL